MTSPTTMNAPPHKPIHLLSKRLSVALRGHNLLNSSRLNKGSAFSISERKDFALEGRLPYRVNTLEEQCERAYGQLNMRQTPIAKNVFLQSLKAQNWTLYFALLARHMKELIPVIYTPTEADAIADYSHLFRRSEGLYLTFLDRERMEEDFLEQTREREIDLVVCTDSEAILGIGDQGVGGIGISTAKSAIYTLVGGLDPAKTLSVVLDVGTDNDKLLNDPLYVGWQNARIRGQEYDEFIDKFVQLVRKHLPNSLLHFEDFGVKNAHRILQRYHDTHAVFNDDIQGTGAVTLACVMAAIGVSRRSKAAFHARSSSQAQTSLSKDRLCDQRYVILGAGSAGLGVATQIRDAMVTADGVSKEDSNSKFWLVDKEGLLFERDQGAQNFYDEARTQFVRRKEEGWDESRISLLDVVRRVHPTVLIGCSTAGGAFNEDVIKAMMEGMEEGARPIVLPLSNPIRLSEARPEDVLRWTKGRALIATGSPFGRVDVEASGRKVGFEISECNNALIYPGLGFGAILSQSRCLSDTMLFAGAERLAELSPAITRAAEHVNDSGGDEGGRSVSRAYEYEGESIMPDFEDAPQINFEIAVTVAVQAVMEGSARAGWAKGLANANEQEVERAVREKAGEAVWVPVYYDYEFNEGGLKDV